ncbi:MAG: hypothetical protein ACFFDN_51645 [Candidatus Hodarchaeota archaeon]
MYENVFFFLSLGKYDALITSDYQTYRFEEFVIVIEKWKDHIEYFENLVQILNRRFIQVYGSQNNKIATFPRIFRIFFAIYTTQSTNQLLGLGLRIISPNSYASTVFASSPNDRLQKAMYLLSRGILTSSHHQIEQIESQIPLKKGCST